MKTTEVLILCPLADDNDPEATGLSGTTNGNCDACGRRIDVPWHKVVK